MSASDYERGESVEALVIPRTSDLGDGFQVRRALPNTQRRMVGPFVFLDQMGPHHFDSGAGLDVRPHPHIGLATVTYLFEGEIVHRDSLGVVQPIRPGEVNWMTAGRGIVHSERTGSDLRSSGHTLAGLQCWVALPKSHEEAEPAFAHIDAGAIPQDEGEGVRARVIAGEFAGRKSPVSTLSPLFYVDARLQAGARLTIPAQYTERAIYVVAGQVSIPGEGSFEAGQLVVLKAGRPVDTQASGGPAHLMLLGGEPMDGPRAILWNFVSSSQERLQQAREDWQNGRFPAVPQETESIPMPDIAGRPVFYP